MRIRLFAPLVFVAALPLYAAVIETSTFCQSGPVTRTGASACVAQFQSGGVNLFTDANAIAREVTPDPQYAYSALVAAGSGLFGWSEGGDLYDLSSKASASVSALFTTTGPVRSGWVDLFAGFDIDGSGGGGSGDATAIVGPYSYGPRPSAFPVREMLPITLGQPFLFEVRALASDSTFVYDGEASLGSYYSVNAQFALYEADGVTPVTPFEVGVPEPAGLGVLGLLLLPAARLLRRRHSA